MGTVSINFEDAHIVIRDGQKNYTDTLANFAADAQATLPATPQNAVSLRYSQADQRLIVSNGDAQREVTAAPWKSRFEWAIGALDSLLQRQSTRNPQAAVPVSESWGARFAALEARIAALEAKA